MTVDISAKYLVAKHEKGNQMLRFHRDTKVLYCWRRHVALQYCWKALLGFQTSTLYIFVLLTVKYVVEQYTEDSLWAFHANNGYEKPPNYYTTRWLPILICSICNDRQSPKRPLGRPRRRRVDNIGMDLQEVGLGYEDWIGLAQDRDRWRTLLSAVMNLRVP